MQVFKSVNLNTIGEINARKWKRGPRTKSTSGEFSTESAIIAAKPDAAKDAELSNEGILSVNLNIGRNPHLTTLFKWNNQEEFSPAYIYIHNKRGFSDHGDLAVSAIYFPTDVKDMPLSSINSKPPYHSKSKTVFILLN